MKHISLLPAAALLCVCSACSNNEQFRVNGTIEDKATMNLRINYSSNGTLRTIVTAARDGKFEFFASSPHPTIVEINDYDNRPITRIYAANGETFDITIDRTKPFGVKTEGNDISTRWADFLRDNSDAMAGGASSANEVIASYIGSHPDDILSTLLLISNYDSSADAYAADSLLALIDAKARPSALTESYVTMLERLVTDNTKEPVGDFRFINADTARTFRAAAAKANLLVFTNEDDEEYKKLAAELDRVAAKLKSAQVLDLRTNPTNASYEGADTCERVLGRLPGGIVARGVEKLGIPDIPYFIVADSSGTQIYRGRDLNAAFSQLDSLYKAN